MTETTPVRVVNEGRRRAALALNARLSPAERHAAAVRAARARWGRRAPTRPGTALVAWRERHGWSAAEAAAGLGLSLTRYRRYEMSPRPLPRLVALAVRGLSALATAYAEGRGR
jgi:hypothetical protein